MNLICLRLWSLYQNFFNMSLGKIYDIPNNQVMMYKQQLFFFIRENSSFFNKQPKLLTFYFNYRIWKTMGLGLEQKSKTIIGAKCKCQVLFIPTNGINLDKIFLGFCCFWRLHLYLVGRSPPTPYNQPTEITKYIFSI